MGRLAIKIIAIIFILFHLNINLFSQQNKNINFVNKYKGGYIYYITSDDNKYLYIGEDEYFKILDVSNPSVPKALGKTQLTKSNMSHIFKIIPKDSFAYIVGNDALYIINMIDPNNLNISGYLQLPLIARDVAIFDQYAFIANLHMLNIVNIKNPYSPTYIASIPNLWCKFVTIKNNILFVLGHALVLFKINNSINYLSDCILPINRPSGLIIKDNLAFVTDLDSGLTIIDFSEIEKPNIIKKFYSSKFRSIKSIAIRDKFLFMLVEKNIVRVMNFINPLEPFEVGYYEIEGIGEGLTVFQNYIYVCAGYNGLYILKFNTK